MYPRQYVDKDVDVLNKCLTAKEGGESAMLEIVIRRSDAHLREVLKAYERRYGVNFARQALKKSNNLVVSLMSFPFQHSCPIRCSRSIGSDADHRDRERSSATSSTEQSIDQHETLYCFVTPSTTSAPTTGTRSYATNCLSRD